MWPQDPAKYNLITRVIHAPESDWRPLTYWQTDVKNLHSVYDLLKYAQNPRHTDGKNWYERSRKKFIEYGLLNAAGRPSRAGMRLIRKVEERLTENPDLFKEDVRPFEFEYFFHKELHDTGADAVFNNVENLLVLVPIINVDDLESIVSVVSVNNGDETLERFNALPVTDKKAFFKSITGLHKELKEVGGKLAARSIARPEWLPYLNLVSRGALGNQNDGYYRAASLFRAHILLRTLLTIKVEGTHSFEDLYNPFASNIRENAFRQLLRTEPEIEETSEGYRYVRNRMAYVEAEYEEEIKTEIQKIKYETLDLTEEEKLAKLKTLLRAAEKSPIVTVPVGQGRNRIQHVRHMRDAKTSAAMRLYFKDVCQYCGFDSVTLYGLGISEVDHAIAEIADTQNNRPSNLMVLCRNCHGAKTKGVLRFTDKGDHFTALNTFSGIEKRINKVDIA